MAQAKKDNNNISTILGIDNTDGATPAIIKANNNIIMANDGTTGSDLSSGRSIAIKDNNNTPVLMAVSKNDGVTPVLLYVDSSGNLLINSS